MAAQDFILTLLRDAARNSRRCPTNDEVANALIGAGYGNTLNVSLLARRGLFRIEVYAYNWRVVEIDGMRTAPCPHKHSVRPYRVIDTGGRPEPERPDDLPQGSAKDRLRAAMGKASA